MQGSWYQGPGITDSHEEDKIHDKYSNLEIVNNLSNSGLLTIPAGDNVIRLLPALIIENEHIEEGDKILREILQNIK